MNISVAPADHYSIRPKYRPLAISSLYKIKISRIFHNHVFSLLLIGCLYLEMGIFFHPLAERNVSKLFLVVGAALLFTIAMVWRNQLRFLVISPLMQKLGINDRVGMGERAFLPSRRLCFKNHARIAKLTYKQDVYGNHIPILKYGLNLTSHDRGYAYGLMLGESIMKLFEEFYYPTLTLVKWKAQDPAGIKLANSGLKIPEEYIHEMEGLVEGIKAYVRLRGMPEEFAPQLEDVLDIHSLIDAYKKLTVNPMINSNATEIFDPVRRVVDYLINRIFITVVACSTTVEKYKGDTWVGRNNDCCTMNLLGKYDLVVHEKTKDKIIESNIYPGLLGGLTMVKKDRLNHRNQLVLIFHTLGKENYDNGIGSLFFLRSLIQEANNTSVVLKKIDQGKLPASSCNLIAIDQKQAINVQFIPNLRQRYILRKLSEDGVMVTTNHYIDPFNEKPLLSEGDDDAFNSSLNRHDRICQAYQLNIDKSLPERIVKCQQAAQEHLTASSYIFHIPSDVSPQIATQRVFSRRYAASNLSIIGMIEKSKYVFYNIFS